MKEVNAAGKCWNADSVTSMSEADFIKDASHAIEGLTDKDNTAALKGVYAECLKAVGKTKKDTDPVK